MTEKTCLNCNNKNCYIVYGVPKERKKDVKEHHEVYGWDWVFDCKKHNKWKGVSNANEQEKRKRNSL